MSARQPTLFVPHGAGPCFFMDWNPAHAWDRMAEYLSSIRNHLPEPPRAILMVSAHWLDAEFRVTTHASPELIYDYYGFPKHTYELTYPAPGDPALAQQVVDLLGEAGLAASGDAQRGFDHGMFIPLKLMFSAADIPVVQLSLRQDMDPEVHVKAGQALASLRDQGVLIVGSGMSFHNMQGYGDPRFGPVSDLFDHWLKQTVEAPAVERNQALSQWAEAPNARLCHPPRAEEHLIPLMVAAGAAGDDAGQQVFTDRVLETRLSGFQFG